MAVDLGFVVLGAMTTINGIGTITGSIATGASISVLSVGIAAPVGVGVSAAGTAVGVGEIVAGVSTVCFAINDFNNNAEGYKRTKVGKSKGNTPGNNQSQNKQVRDVLKEIGKNTPENRDILHREISKQGYGYQEILEIAKDLFE
jgi:vacuolar-type H+-ATPase subunit I/STV1